MNTIHNTQTYKYLRTPLSGSLYFAVTGKRIFFIPPKHFSILVLCQPLCDFELN